MVLTKLREVLEALEFENAGSAAVTALRVHDQALSLEVGISYGGEDLASQRWQLCCKEHRAYVLRPEPIETIDLRRAHILLAPYQQPQAQLSFLGLAAEPKAVIADLWQAHEASTDGWLDLRDYVNPNLPLLELLASGSGELAAGPRSLLDVYSAVLERHGIKVSILAEHPPLRWYEGAWRPEAFDLEVLLLGASYVIGREWDIREVPSAVAA